MNFLDSLVTVVIPAYNHEKFISDCIESIIKQDYKNIELIILNDGSVDRTANKILEYEAICKERFRNFIFIDKDNEGVSKTINMGINLSKGEYICLIASDDVMIEGRITKQIEFMKNKNSNISCGNSLVMEGNTKTNIPVIDNNLKKNYYDGSQFYNLIINYFISSPTVMMKRSLIDEMGFYDEKFKIEDWPYYVKLSEKYSIDFIDDYLCYYRIHDDNTQTNKEDMFIEEEKILRYFFITYKLPLRVKRMAMGELYLRNKSRHVGKISKFIDVVISQIYYLDIKRIKEYIMKSEVNL